MYLLDVVLQSASTQAQEINRLHIYFYFAAGFILLVVTLCTIFILYKFRHRPSVEHQPKTLSRRWEIPMIGVPLIMVIIFFFLMLDTMHKVLPGNPTQQPDAVIIGHQYWWEAQYPGKNVTTANEIHLPAGKPLLLKLLSADVIHDWWVPSFGNKMDLISGRENYLWLNIKKPGRYLGACSEFCGDQHANMHIIVIAHNQQDYEQWAAHHATAATSGQNPLALQGQQIFNNKTCGNCHNIKGTTANGTSGPDLTHLASRSTLLTGVLANDADNLKKWLAHPQDIKPGAKMPSFLLDDQSLNALVAYLTSLK